MPGLKKIVWLITTFFILTGIFLGVLLSERRPQLPQLVRTQQQKTEATSNTSLFPHTTQQKGMI